MLSSKIRKLNKHKYSISQTFWRLSIAFIQIFQTIKKVRKNRWRNANNVKFGCLHLSKLLYIILLCLDNVYYTYNYLIQCLSSSWDFGPVKTGSIMSSGESTLFFCASVYSSRNRVNKKSLLRGWVRWGNELLWKTPNAEWILKTHLLSKQLLNGELSLFLWGTEQTTYHIRQTNNKVKKLRWG